jgi:hypothetical protein
MTTIELAHLALANPLLMHALRTTSLNEIELGTFGN